MANSFDSDESVVSLDDLDSLASLDTASESFEPAEDVSLEHLGLELVRRQHDRINELYYEAGCSDAAAEAVALAELGLTPAWISTLMTATGRSNVSAQTVATLIEECNV